MAHRHEHRSDCGHDQHQIPQKQAAIAYGVASCVGVLAIMIQSWGVYGSHSNSLLADTFHLAADVWFNIASGLALFYRARSSFPGLLPGAMLILTGAGSVLLGASRLDDPFIASAWSMFIAALIGLLLNLCMFSIIHRYAGGGHTHAHGHEHHDSNVKHLLADTVSSAVVTLASLLLILWPGFGLIRYLDPLLSILIGVWLMREGGKKVL